jgi:hypothetical protein
MPHNHSTATSNGARSHSPEMHWLTLLERAFRPADRLDYLIRRWVFPKHLSKPDQMNSNSAGTSI